MKISKMTGAMAKARHYLPCKTLLILYNTMIYPFLTYCNTIWASTYATRLQSIFRIQKKIVRIVTFSNLKDDSRPLFESLKILDIYKLNTCLTALFMYSYHHNKLPTFFTEQLLYNQRKYTFLQHTIKIKDTPRI